MIRTLALLVGLLALAPAASVACSCAQPPDPATALGAAAAVFEARAVGGPIGEAAEGRPMGSVEYEFEVLRSWKGSPEPIQRIRTNASSAACGRSYTKGVRYIIYAHQSEDGVLHDNICTRTRSSDNAAEDFEAHGAGTTLPAAPKRAETSEDGASSEAPAEQPKKMPKAAEEPVEEATAAPVVAAEKPAEPEPAKEPAEEPDDEDEVKDAACSAAGRSTSVAALLLLPLAIRRRR